MYIEYKGDGLTDDARIGRVKFSKTMKSIHYGGKLFKSLKGDGFKSNFYDEETGDEYWISGCRQDGADRLYHERTPIYILMKMNKNNIGQKLVICHKWLVN